MPMMIALQIRRTGRQFAALKCVLQSAANASPALK
jgi:hypothetical protein